jgi:heat shock protein HtpX
MVTMAATPAAVLGLVLTVVLTFLVGPVGLLIGLAIAAAAVLWVVSMASFDPTPRLLAQMEVRDADRPSEARLVNLVDGLSLNGGISAPTLHVADTEALNALVIGLRDGEAHVVVTSGLLDALERIELEAVLARAVVQIRRGDLGATTTALQVLHSTKRGGTYWLVRPVAGTIARRVRVDDPDADVVLDRDAVGLTRYPPGLVGALKRLVGAPLSVPGATQVTSSLWLADPLPPDRPDRAPRTPIADRIEALELL